MNRERISRLKIAGLLAASVIIGSYVTDLDSFKGLVLMLLQEAS